jgi:hypothetical protein
MFDNPTAPPDYPEMAGRVSDGIDDSEVSDEQRGQ